MGKVSAARRHFPSLPRLVAVATPAGRGGTYPEGLHCERCLHPRLGGAGPCRDPASPLLLEHRGRPRVLSPLFEVPLGVLSTGVGGWAERASRARGGAGPRTVV